ncbi:MAG: DUF1700 domain-containing protein [Clostridia bacterium]|nr:DUF1700 domain-containing protein [Clostridia bacterium]
MNKQEFMELFSSELETLGVEDRADIIAEYENHFAFRLADGYTEEEIAARLGDPKLLALQFDSEPPERSAPRRIAACFIAALSDVLALVLGAVLTAWIVVMGAISVASVTLGFCLALNVNVFDLFTEVPYVNCLLFGLSFIFFGIFGASCSVFCTMYALQWVRVYRRARARIFSGSSLPEKSAHPALGRPLTMTLSLTAMISLAAFGVLFIVSFVILALHEGNIAFWQNLGWFN